MRRILLYFIIFLPLVAQTIVDFDIATGKKPLPEMVDLKSKLPFSLKEKSITSYFSDYSVKDNKPPFLKLEKNAITEEFTDLDLTELFETWGHIEKGNLIFEAKLDEAKEVIREKTFYKENGDILWVFIDRDLSGLFDEIHIYHNKKIYKTLRDENQDKLFETELVFFLPGEEKGVREIAEKTIPQPTFPPNTTLYFAGLYEQEKELTPVSHLEKAVEEAFPFLVNQKNFIFQEIRPKKRFPNRLEIFKAAKKNLGEKFPPGYILYGEVLETPGRFSINIKIFGPEAKDLFYSKHLVYPRREFTTSQFIQDLKNSLHTLGITTHSAWAQP